MEELPKEKKTMTTEITLVFEDEGELDKFLSALDGSLEPYLDLTPQNGLLLEGMAGEQRDADPRRDKPYGGATRFFCQVFEGQ